MKSHINKDILNQQRHCEERSSLTQHIFSKTASFLAVTIGLSIYNYYS